MFKLKFQLLFDTPTPTGSGGGDGELTPDKILDFFNEESESKEDTEIIDLDSDKGKDKKGKKASKETTDSEEGSDDSGEEEEDEEDLEDKVEKELREEEIDEEDELDPALYHTRRQILAKYPTLFKDFPGLQRAYYREQKYSELLPSLEDAQRAVENSELLLKYGQEIASGSLKSVLKDSRETNPEAFAQLADNYLVDLHAVDKEAYNHVFGNIVALTVQSMLSRAKNISDEDSRGQLVAAAKILSKHIFGNDDDIPQIKKMGVKSDSKSERESEIEERERKLSEREYNKHVESLETRVGNTVKATLDKFIDPNNRMSEYVKDKAITDAQTKLDEQLLKDTRFTKIVKRLWERAIEDDYSTESLDRIKEAVISKSRTLLPEIIKEVRNQALRGLGKKSSSDNDGETNKGKGPLPVGQTRRTAASSSGKTDKDKAREIPRGMSTLDYFNQD